MKKRLRNKETGQVFETIQPVLGGDGMSIAELSEKWEDVLEEPNPLYVIDPDCLNYINRIYKDDAPAQYNRAIEMGLGFEKLEEAEKAVARLKAFTRLKDRGFKFVGWKNGKLEYPDYVSFDCEDYDGCNDDLDLIFGGEE